MAIIEQPREVPVIGEFDICVLGGSCTGVFAALRAARLGMKVCVVEREGSFGGTATAGLVNIWHSFEDALFEKTIIGGLSQEVVERLKGRHATSKRERNHDLAFLLNSEELKIELDELVQEAASRLFLHCWFAAPHVEDGHLRAVCVENKDGRGAIRARIFIDATGDGDLARRLGVPGGVNAHPRPPTRCAKIYGLEGLDVWPFYPAHREEFDLEEDAGWNCEVPGSPQAYACTRKPMSSGPTPRTPSELTGAEIEGRRHVRAIMDMIRKYHPDRSERLCLLALGSCIGIRETRRSAADYD